MRSIPVDINTFMTNIRGVSGIDPVTDFDTGEHKRDKEGVKRWKLEVLYREPRMSKSEVVQVAFSAHDEPDVNGGELVITGLVGRPWSNSNDYGHSSGVSLQADSVTFRPVGAARNGAKGEPVGSSV